MRAVNERLPTFIAIGPPRTGTTWLHGVLYHRACLPDGIKETRFFDMFYSRGPQWYMAHFRNQDGGRPVGEISPTYFRSAEARERIARDLPNCKIVCTLRDPVTRAYSQYRQIQTLGLTRGSFEHEIRTNDRLVEFTRYGFHLRAWYERFGRERVGVFFYDDLEANPQSFADAVCRFIGVEPLLLTPEIARFLDRNEVNRAAPSRLLARSANRLRSWLRLHHGRRASNLLERYGVWRFCSSGGPQFEPLAPELEMRLREHFLAQVEEVEQLTGRDLSHWKPSAARAAPARRRARLSGGGERSSG